ncbi:hypothetical protein CMUS01_07715 [Colletotrichum musicola]|uniref:Uncharacterized protein n=1 Tax=Colletotrichum musicola TaxID=2175873 RepID=A0A8H6NF18_9PEZI|nr:hypothetical protein CMUS01_07715 [Colletotrichum musicola]
MTHGLNVVRRWLRAAHDGDSEMLPECGTRPGRRRDVGGMNESTWQTKLSQAQEGRQFKNPEQKIQEAKLGCKRVLDPFQLEIPACSALARLRYAPGRYYAAIGDEERAAANNENDGAAETVCHLLPFRMRQPPCHPRLVFPPSSFLAAVSSADERERAAPGTAHLTACLKRADRDTPGRSASSGPRECEHGARVGLAALWERREHPVNHAGDEAGGNTGTGERGGPPAGWREGRMRGRAVEDF